MIKTELVTLLKESLLNEELITAELYFILKQDQVTLLRFIDIEGETQEDLTKQFIEKVKSELIEDDSLDLISISNADDRNKVLYEYDLDEVPEEIKLINTILKDEDIPSFDFRTDELAQIKGIIVLMSNNNHNLLLYKKHYPVSLIRKDNTFTFKRIGDHKRFVSVEEDIVRINTNFEFLMIDDSLIIKELATLEKFFGFHEIIKKKAQECIIAIEQSGLLEDADVLKELIDEISYSRKLTKVLNSSPVLNKIPTPSVIAFTNIYPALKGQFQYNADNSKIVLSTKKSKHLFAKLLNDDFLQSELTKMFYDSLAKDNIPETVTS
ncbi:anti-phage protein KwaB [Paenibacillus amylolyticus]|uniref:anti-phage protein KwaB n=1 Tax=Paenibacillus amylolyticus TaxID=1451 RepID=UPI00344DC9B8